MSILIIPSAKLVPEELQSIGKLPGIIYPINQKIVFDYLYDQYKDICEKIKIVCYEEAKRVHQRLGKYENKNVILEDLPYLDDLGHTVYYAIKEIDDPVFINFSDTIVMDDIVSSDKNYFYYAEDYLSNKWTFFQEKDGEITSIYDKKNIRSKVSEKLFVGLFRIEHTRYLKECLEKSFLTSDREVSSFFQAIQSYSRKFPLKAIKTRNWFDIGHADTYYNSKLEVKAREFNHISIDKARGILRKTSDDKEKFIGEVKWYLKLPGKVEYVRPRIFDYSTSYNEPYVEMEYYAYHTVHELFLYGDLTYHQWIEIFKRIKFVCDDFKKFSVKGIDIRNALEEMYLSKTLERMEQLKSDKYFSKFFVQSICVNGVVYKSLNEICTILEDEIPKCLYDVNEFVIIHGDMCFTNIMIDGSFSFVKLIDPRGKFGSYDIYGDFRYELAKLLHSVDGKYDYIIKGLFAVEYDVGRSCINFEIHDRGQEYDLYQIFTDVFKQDIGGDLKKIELIEALLFLSMIPLHKESLEHQMVMLATGLGTLNRVLDIQK